MEKDEWLGVCFGRGISGFIVPESYMKVICPKCKSEHTASIMYGYPAPEAWETSGCGEIIIGGCTVFPHQEDYGCLDCNHRWIGLPDAWN